MQVRLADVASFSKGKLVKTETHNSTGASLPYLTIEALEGKVKEYVATGITGTYADTDDVLVVADGSRSGLAFYGHRGLAASTIFKVSSTSPLVRTKYIYYISQLNKWSGRNYRKGSTVPHFDYKKALSESIVIPSIEKQDEYIALLSAIDSSSNTTQRNIDETVRLKKALMNDLISDESPRQPLADLLEEFGTGVSVRADDRKMVANNEVGVLKISAVTYLTFNPDKYKVVHPDQTGRLTKSVTKNTLLVSRANTPDLVGACVYIDSDYPNLYLPDKLWELKPKKDTSVRWLNYVLQKYFMMGIPGSLATGTSQSMRNISQAKYKQILVPKVDILTQEKIADLLGAIDEKIRLENLRIVKQQDLKQGLMQDLLQGEAA